MAGGLGWAGGRWWVVGWVVVSMTWSLICTLDWVGVGVGWWVDMWVDLRCTILVTDIVFWVGLGLVLGG